MRPQSHLMGLILTSVFAACSGTNPIVDSGAGEVGTRGLSQVQQPVSSQPGAQGESNFQPPTFPQKFDVQGPEMQSFGFAVTQPGPITIDVQTQGSPVVVTLQMLGGSPLAQQGTGVLRLNYQVTPADVQRSAFWRVQLRLVESQKVGQAARGSVMAQFPPPDQNLMQMKANALKAERDSTRPQRMQRAHAAMANVFQQHKAKFDQDQQQKHAAMKAQVQPIVDQIRTQMAIQPRGIEEPQPALATTQPEEDVGTRGLTSGLSVAPMAQQPAPIISNVNVTQGQPQQPIIITGKNFGRSGDVIFAMAPPNIGYPGKVEAWSDTMIVVDVPDQSGLFQYNGQVFVSTPSGRSNQMPFTFIPAEEVRVISHTSDWVLARPVQTYSDHNSIYHGTENVWGLFAGGKGNDVLFPTSRLKPGWVVQTVFLNIHDSEYGTNSIGAIVEDFRPSSDTPYINIHWWYDAFNELTYTWGVYIVGPRGVSDGIVVP